MALVEKTVLIEQSAERMFELVDCCEDYPVFLPWCFKPLAENACKIEFKLHYEFSSKLFEKVIGPVFNHIANSFVDAFVHRATQVYGVDHG